MSGNRYKMNKQLRSSHPRYRFTQTRTRGDIVVDRNTIYLYNSNNVIPIRR